LFEERISTGQFTSDHYYSDWFWKNTDEKNWSDIKNLVDKAMGNLTSYSLVSWNVQSKIHTANLSGTFVVLVYATTYDKGNGTETLTIHKPLRGDTFSILGHHFNSQQIQQLINKGIKKVATRNDV
jgi:hypothetical protein